MTPRALPLPPDERRAEIIAAARPLLLEHGGRFTTRQVAEAAGIAEGTLFRVFPTKRDLMHAVIGHMVDPTEMCAWLDAIDLSQPLEVRVRLVIERMQRDIDDISAIFAALFSMPNDDVRNLGHEGGPKNAEDRERHEQRAAMLHAALVRVLEPDAAHLACTVDEAASLIRSLAFATSHPHMSDRRISDPARLSILVLGGLVRRDEGQPTTATPTTSNTATTNTDASTKEQPC